MTMCSANDPTCPAVLAIIWRERDAAKAENERLREEIKRLQLALLGIAT